MNKRKLLLSGFGIFLAGLLAGGAGMAVYHKVRMSPLVRMEQHGPVDFFMERLDHHLDLTDQQKQAIRPIVADVIHMIQDAREPCMRAEENAFKEGRERLVSQLTPDQAKKFNEFMDRAKERRQKFLGHP